VKYVVLVPDGAADYPQESLDGKTPLEAAHTPNMDRLAREGSGGMVQIIPEVRPPGSDIGNLELFGYDSVEQYTGRAPLEAASMGVELPEGAIAFRCNLINCEGDTLVDYSAGHISTEEGQELIRLVAAELEEKGIRFYPGVQYRHLMVYQDGPEELVSYPPHDIMGESASGHLPTGEGQEKIRELMAAAEPILARAEVNAKRVAAGQRPGNHIWLWGSGRGIELESFASKYGLCGGVISAVDLVRGIGRSAGLEVIEVPGITGYLDTNYAGKASYALAALERSDFVYVHVEAADEAAHNGDPQAKVQALEDFDRLVVGNIIEGLGTLGECRLLMAPDHRTPIQLRTHSREPVPFVLWGSDFPADGMQGFNETAAEAGSLQLERGHHMMEHLMGRRSI
jgi:2,3-bisphosphoglycerate-independent phosphoglycerate mutase